MKMTVTRPSATGQMAGYECVSEVGAVHLLLEHSEFGVSLRVAVRHAMVAHQTETLSPVARHGQVALEHDQRARHVVERDGLYCRAVTRSDAANGAAELVDVGDDRNAGVG